MKVSELTGVDLDYWVAKAIGHEAEYSSEMTPPVVAMIRLLPEGGFKAFSPSTKWQQGGPIIEQERINFVDCAAYWEAYDENFLRDRQFAAFIGNPDGLVDVLCGEYEGLKFDNCQFGPTPLIAAMRAFVASKFGEEVSDGI